METIPMIIPDMKFANVFSGAKNGLSGGICNVVYYSCNLSKDRILLEPSENTINIKPIKNIAVLNLKKLNWVFDFIIKQLATKADKIM